MGSTYHPTKRRHGMIGCNLRPGFKPGGFTGSGDRKGPRAKRASMATIKDAAKTFMQERGIEPMVPKDGFVFGSKAPEAP